MERSRASWRCAWASHAARLVAVCCLLLLLGLLLLLLHLSVPIRILLLLRMGTPW